MNQVAAMAGIDPAQVPFIAAHVGLAGVGDKTVERAVAGTEIQSFTLKNREISRRDGRLMLVDGTLAGADLDMATAVRNLTSIGVALAQALAMATLRPAAIIGGQGDRGHLRPGGAADSVWLDAHLRLDGVWRGGSAIKSPERAV